MTARDFPGDVEAGYKNALSVLAPSVDPEQEGINIDGACLFDPFSCGNVREIVRLLGNASVPSALFFARTGLKAWGMPTRLYGGNKQGFFQWCRQVAGGDAGV
ncbi:MAG: hypothetical protein MZV63_37330 [Marinilabiliales bacterium]|nr:hypothetical protein [Marinilabiliales bacterium]